MVNKNKIIISTVALTAMLGAGAYGIKSANAQNIGGMRMAERFSQRFNLDENEVEEYFKEIKKEKRASLQKKFEDILSEAVSKGELTEAQRTLIIEKRKDLIANRKNNQEKFKNLFWEEKKEQIKEQKRALKKWAEENGINLKYPNFGKRWFGFLS